MLPIGDFLLDNYAEYEIVNLDIRYDHRFADCSV